MTSRPLSECADNLYYLTDDTIFKSHLKSFGKEIKFTQKIITDKNNMLLKHYKFHLEELAMVK